MKEIKVGEYIRTKQGEIAKIIDTNIFDKTIYKDVQGAKYYLEDITKHSPNIIDLIEVGDYVNGDKINCVENEYYNLTLDEVLPLETPNLIVGNEEGILTIDINDIKSIVTKEQFKSVMYEV